MKNKYRLLLFGCILISVTGGCASQKNSRIDVNKANHNHLLENITVSANEWAGVEGVIENIGIAENGVPYIVEDDVSEHSLFTSFINNEIQAYGGINKTGVTDQYPIDQTTAYDVDDQKRFFTDYLKEYSWLPLDRIHFMAEDLDGDGEGELLIELGFSSVEGYILVFHEQDENLFEWEMFKYGNQSRYIHLYDNSTIEVVGIWGNLYFSRYNPGGRRVRVFGRYSSKCDEGNNWELCLYEYEDGVVVNEIKITEEWSDDNEFIGILEGDAKKKEFDRVYNEFMNTLGEEKSLNSSVYDFDDAPEATRKEIMNGFQFITN